MPQKRSAPPAPPSDDPVGGIGIDAAAFSELVGAIYACVLDPRAWPDALRRVRVALGSHNASIALHDLRHGEVLLEAADGIAPSWLLRMHEYAEDVVALWGGAEAYASLPLLEPLVLSRLRGGAHRSNRYYREWAEPQGLIDVIGMGIVRDHDAVGTLGFGWHRSAPPIGARDIALLRLLTPHFHRALAITRLVRARSLIDQALEQAFDAMRVPVVIVGQDLSVRHANAAARDAFAQRAPFRHVGGKLVAAERTVGDALDQALDRIAHKAFASGARTLGIAASDAAGAPCILHLLPLDGHSGLAAIFVASAAGPQHADGEILRALYGLTQAEAGVFERIAGGATVSAAAAMLGISVSTVRSHLLRIFEKTGTRRQSELAKLGAALASPLRPENT